MGRFLSLLFFARDLFFKVACLFYRVCRLAVSVSLVLQGGVLVLVDLLTPGQRRTGQRRTTSLETSLRKLGRFASPLSQLCV